MKGNIRILLWEPDARAKRQALSTVADLGIDALVCDAFSDLVAAAQDVDAVVLASIDGPERDTVLRELVLIPRPERILLMADAPDFANRLASVRLRVRHLIAKPVDAMGLRLLLDRVPPLSLLVAGLPADSDLCMTLAREADMALHFAADGLEALRQASQTSPDLVVSAAQLPDCTGAELHAVLLGDERCIGLPVIVVTREDGEPNPKGLLADGGADSVDLSEGLPFAVAKIRRKARDGRITQMLSRKLQQAERAVHSAHLALDAHAIVSVTDPAGTITYANERFCRTSGYSLEELLGRDHRLLRSGAHSDDYFANLWATLRENRTWQGEMCNRAKDGTLYWVQATITPVPDADGAPSDFVSVCTDISVQKEVEGRLYSVLNSANVGLAWVDMEGWIQEVNDTFVRMTGYSRDELMSMRADAFTREWDPHNIPAQLATLAEGQRTARFQKRYLRKGGDAVWADVMLTRVNNADGTMRGAVGSVIDITRQKVAEDRLGLVVRGSLDGIWDWSARSRQVYYSRRFRELLGFAADEEESFNAYFRLVSVVHPEDFGPARRALLAHLRGRDGGVFDVALRFLHRDGQYRWFRARGRGVWDDRGAPERFAGSFTDLTELKRVEDELRASKEAAEHASHAKTEFLSHLTHELRTPMNSILGFAQLMESDPAQRLSPSHMENLAQIQRAGWHLLDLINEVLDLARIEAGRMEVVLEDFPVSDVLDDCLTLISLLATKQGVTVFNRLSDGFSPLVRADPMRLKQAVLNLLSNAVKYNRRGGMVYLDVVSVKDGWRLDVSDTGIGLSESQLAALFQPFTRFAEEGAREGSGIGLAITKRLIEAMGGRIEVASECGKGSTFSVTLPVGREQNSGRLAGRHRLLA